MKLKAYPPMVLKKAAAAVYVPKLLSCGAPASVSIKNAIAMKIPPAIVNGNILETPFIRCLYIFLPKLSLSPESCDSPAPPAWW